MSRRWKGLGRARTRGRATPRARPPLCDAKAVDMVRDATRECVE